MKEQFILIMVQLSVIFAAQAQVPVIGTSSYFQLNHFYPYKYKIDTSLWAVTPGSSGANILWDFSAINFSDYFTIDTTLRIDPRVTEKFLVCGISGIDTANICLLNKSVHVSRTDNYGYYQLHNGVIMQTGSDQDNGVVEDINFTFSKTRLNALMPFTYLNNRIDSFSGSYLSYLSGFHYISGIDSIVADAYGTLRVDGQIFKNCVRTKTSNYLVDSNVILGKNIYKHITYTWYSSQKEGPILALGTNVDTTTPNRHILEAMYYFPVTPTLTKNNGTELTDLVVYPVPAKSNLFISVKSQQWITSPIEFVLFDASGHLVFKKELNSNVNNIDISMLPNSVYCFKVICGEVTKSGIISKE